MARRVAVDREVCMGSGQCCVYAPDAFEIDEEAKAVFHPSADSRWPDILTAVEACPTGALRLVDDGVGGREYG